MLSVLLYFLFQPAHAVEYTCTQVHHLNRPLEHLAAGFLEQSLDWEVINTVNPWILNSRLKLNLIKNETGTLTSYLKFNVKKNQYQIPLNSLTLSKSAVHELKYAAASGMMTMDPFQKNVVSLHERYQFSIDSLAEYETTPEERALMSLRKLNIPDPTILTDYLNSEDGRNFVLDQAKRFQAIIESKAHFARIAVNDDVIFPLLGQGFKVFTGRDVAFILSADYQWIGVCLKSQRAKSNTLTTALFSFLTDPDVIAVLNCEDLLRTPAEKTY